MRSRLDRYGLMGILGLFVIIVFIVAIQDRDYTGAMKNPDSTKEIWYTHPSTQATTKIDNSYDNPKPSIVIDRQETLKTKVKGYRETTYWGAEHALDKKVPPMNDGEFERYVNEEVNPNDHDVYWGAEY